MRVLLLTISGDGEESGARAVARGLENAGHEVVTRPGSIAAFRSAAGRDRRAGKYVLAGGRMAVLFSEAEVPGFDLAAAVCPVEAAGDVEVYNGRGLLSGRRSEGVPPAVEDGPRLERLREILEEFILCEMGPERFLRDFGWRRELRLRDEEFGGLLFVPDTSLLVELDAEACRLVRQAIAAGVPAVLAQDGQPECGRLAASLYRVGALEKR